MTAQAQIEPKSRYKATDTTPVAQWRDALASAMIRGGWRSRSLFSMVNTTLRCAGLPQKNNSPSDAKTRIDLFEVEAFEASTEAILINNYCALCPVLRADRSRIRAKYVLMGWWTEDYSILSETWPGMDGSYPKSGATSDVSNQLGICGLTVQHLYDFLDDERLVLWIVGSATVCPNQ